jgi:uncharacterized protein (TIGR03083 family)
MTTDDSELDGLDPYALLDDEALRIDTYLSDLPDARWDDPSRCSGWSVRDVLCHLAATETYHHACLRGGVRELFAAAAAQGLGSLGDWNERGVRSFDGVPARDVLAQWRRDNAETRSGFRAADGSDIDSSIGVYPGRWQAFHVASELAVHADDMGVPVAEADRAARRTWRAHVSRFALAEAKPELAVTTDHGRTTVTSADATVTVEDDLVVEGVAGRLQQDVLDAASRALLSATP